MTRKKVSNKAKRLSKKTGRTMKGGLYIGRISHENHPYVYRTLHRHPDDCTVFTRVPRGWEVAPGNAHDKDMCKYHDWQYPIIMFGDNSHCVCWSGISIGAQMSTPPIPHLETDGLNEYRTNRKNATILLRRLISEEAADSCSAFSPFKITQQGPNNPTDVRAEHPSSSPPRSPLPKDRKSQSPSRELGSLTRVRGSAKIRKYSDDWHLSRPHRVG